MEDHHVLRSEICTLCDDRIEDEPVGYRDPVEVVGFGEGLGMDHPSCAEEYPESIPSSR